MAFVLSADLGAVALEFMIACYRVFREKTLEDTMRRLGQ